MYIYSGRVVYTVVLEKGAYLKNGNPIPHRCSSPGAQRPSRNGEYVLCNARCDFPTSAHQRTDECWPPGREADTDS